MGVRKKEREGGRGVPLRERERNRKRWKRERG